MIAWINLVQESSPHNEKILVQKDDEYEKVLNEMDKRILGLMSALQNLQNDFADET